MLCKWPYFRPGVFAILLISTDWQISLKVCVDYTSVISYSLLEATTSGRVGLYYLEHLDILV